MQARTIESNLRSEGEAVKSGLQNLGQTISDRTEQVTEDVRRMGGDAYEHLRGVGERGASEVRKHVQNEPMKAMLCGACAGFVLGYFLRR